MIPASRAAAGSSSKPSSNRFFRVTNREESSDWFPVTAGVPQGSVIAPLLFVIYINDIIPPRSRARVLLFADDIVILPRMTPKSPFKYAYSSLKQALSHIQKWSIRSGLEISYNKSNIVVFANAEHRNPQSFKLGRHVLLSRYQSALQHEELERTHRSIISESKDDWLYDS